MGYTYDETKVRADLFKPSGKWMYTVVLDYDGGDWYASDLARQAREALMRATERGVSGVSIKALGDWTMVVLEPYSRFSYPILVKASDD
jgi:hypothetical protein